MKLQTILLAVDSSQPARAAACQARLLAGRFGAALKLLHVVSYPLAIPGAPAYGVHLGEFFSVRAAQESSELKSFFAKELSGAEPEYIVLEGDPARRIVEWAASNAVDLIVMPAHGQGPFRRFLLGSVTAKVLHDVDCPVWTGVHQEDTPCPETLAIQTVVCAVNLGPDSGRLIGWAADFAASFEARLFLVHVVPRPEMPDPEAGDDAPDPAAGRAQLRLEALRKQCGADAIVIIARGDDIPRAVCGQSEELRADLMLIGRSPQSGILGRLPTTAYAIVRDSRCPVVSV